MELTSVGHRRMVMARVRGLLVAGRVGGRDQGNGDQGIKVAAARENSAESLLPQERRLLNDVARHGCIHDLKVSRNGRFVSCGRCGRMGRMVDGLVVWTAVDPRFVPKLNSTDRSWSGDGGPRSVARGAEVEEPEPFDEMTGPMGGSVGGIVGDC